ncbi:MAG: acylphosphatase [Pseudomonadales bacterium]
MAQRDDIRACRGRLEGRVQGVSFRASMQAQARRCGVDGWVSNTADGAVTFLVQGPAEGVRQVLDWARRGPPGASVDAFNLTETDPVGGMSGFDVRG